MTRYRLCRSTRSGHPPIHLTQPVLLQPSRSSCSSHFCTSVLNHISQPRIAILLNNTLRTRTAPASLCIYPASSTTATLRAIPLCFAFVVVELPGLQRNPSSYTTVIPSSTTTTTTTTNHVAILQLRCPAAPRPTSQRPLAQPPRRPIAEGAPDLGSAAQQAVPPSPHPQGIQRRAPTLIAYKRDFEAARSFDIEDDEMFCPFHLLTEDDVSRQYLPPVIESAQAGADTR